jgi:hypothetical protein
MRWRCDDKYELLLRGEVRELTMGGEDVLYALQGFCARDEKNGDIRLQGRAHIESADNGGNIFAP